MDMADQTNKQQGSVDDKNRAITLYSCRIHWADTCTSHNGENDAEEQTYNDKICSSERRCPPSCVQCQSEQQLLYG